MKSDYVAEIRSKIGHMPMFSPVVTLIIYKDGKILLQKRHDNGAWAIHGGGIEPKEKYLDTLMREIKEELGIVPLNPKLMGIFSGEELYNIYPNGDEVYVLNHVFICNNYTGNINFSDGEVEDLKWFDLEHLPDNIFKVNKPVINSIKKFIETGNVIVE